MANKKGKTTNPPPPLSLVAVIVSEMEKSQDPGWTKIKTQQNLV
jgi:hypothetical protein